MKIIILIKNIINLRKGVESNTTKAYFEGWFGFFSFFPFCRGKCKVFIAEV